MKYLLTILVIVHFNSSVLATAQRPDMIKYKGQTFSLQTNPLEPYFDKFPDQRPKTEVISTALWRGYVATFEILDNQMMLIDFQVMTSGRDFKSVLGEVFPGYSKIKVDWFTGLLVLPHGEIVNYVHMGYASTFENYYIVEIDKGNFVQDRQFTHKEHEDFRDKQFQEFKKTDDYKKLVETLSKHGNSSPTDNMDDFIKIFVTDYTSKILTKD